MATLDTALHSIGVLEELSGYSSPIHRIDPRAKLVTTLVYIAFVTSFGSLELLRLIPYALYPVVLLTMSDLPASAFWRRIVVVSPFAVFIGIFNPLFDREIALRLGNWGISGGWLSFGVIVLKFVLTVFSSLLLIATTGFYRICGALLRLKVPEVFVTQLLFMYRYIFLLIHETTRASRAHSLRAFRKRGMAVQIFGSFVGQLLLRTLERAHRIYTAMASRGFDGQVHFIRTDRLRIVDGLYTAGWISLFVIFRVYDLPVLLGGLLLGSSG